MDPNKTPNLPPPKHSQNFQIPPISQGGSYFPPGVFFQGLVNFQFPQNFPLINQYPQNFNQNPITMTPTYFLYAPHLTSANFQPYTPPGTFAQTNSDQSPHTPISKSSQYPQYSTQQNLEEEGDDENEGDQGRRKKWEENDDKHLTYAWLRTSKDPIVRNNEVSQTFWRRVHKSFEEGQAMERGKKPQKRTWTQCKSRWSKISKDVMKFGAYYDKIKQATSEKSEYDYIKDTHGLFKQNEQKRCTVEHCWVILRNEPKWMSQIGNVENSQSKRTINTSGTYSSSSSSSDSNNEGSEQVIRPPGKALARRGKEKVGNSEMVQEFTQELSSLNRDRAELLHKINKRRKDRELEASMEKERRKQEKERRKRLEWERSIMMADISSMDEVQRQWIEEMRREIIKTRRNR